MFQKYDSWLNVPSTRTEPHLSPDYLSCLFLQTAGVGGRVVEDRLEMMDPEDGQPHIVEVGLTSSLQQHQGGLVSPTLHDRHRKCRVTSGPEMVKLHQHCQPLHLHCIVDTKNQFRSVQQHRCNVRVTLEDGHSEGRDAIYRNLVDVLRPCSPATS